MASPSAVPRSHRRFFSPIHTVDDVRKTIRDARYAFYALAALQAVVGLLAQQFALLYDVWVYLLLAFLVGRTKSRAIAFIMVAWMLYVLGLTVAQKAGVYQGPGGSNIVLAAIGLYYALRAAYATLRYHAIISTRVNVGAVVALSAIAVVLNLVIGVACLFGLALLGYDFESEANEQALGMGLLGIATAVTLLVFARVMPFTGRFVVIASQEIPSPEQDGRTTG